MKKILTNRFFQLLIFIVLILIIFLVGCTNTSSNDETDDVIIEETIIPTTEEVIILLDEPILYSDLFVYEFSSIEETEAFINYSTEAINNLNYELSIADKYTDNALNLMQEEVARIELDLQSATTQLNVFKKWEAKESEYYYATHTWYYLKNLGYSDIACAGIIGNLMAECGGNTLNINPYISDGSGRHYGMFQWSVVYYPAAVGMTFEEQLDFYAKTSIPIFKTWGKLYEKDFTLDAFNQLNNPREAALAFAKVYERCASWTYERRQNFAEVAYEYFVLDFQI